MTWLSRLSLANRKIIALLALIVVGLGIYVIPQLKQQVFPDLTFPAVTVVSAYPGAGPEVVESQVTTKIEAAVKGLDGVESMTSTSRQGSSNVVIMFDFGADTSAKAGDIQQAISKLTAQLPSGVTPTVVTGSVGDLPTISLAATSDADLGSFAKELQDTVIPQLKAIDGVNDVQLSGTRDRVLVVTPDEAKLAGHGLTVSSVTSALSAIGTATPAGAFDVSGKSLSIAVGSSGVSARTVQNLWLAPGTSASALTGVAAPAGLSGSVFPGAGGAPGTTGAMGVSSGAAAGGAQPVQLKDVAQVAVRDADATSITRTDGRDSLGLAITMGAGGSSSSISSEVRDLLPSLQSSLSHNAKLTVVSDFGPAVSRSVNGLVEEGLLGLVMAVIVILLFLRSTRSTLVTAVSIPLSLIIALIVLWIQDYSLNLLTLGGLTMAVGRVVDDSIVVLENIKRHLGYGEDKRHAILTAVQEVAMAVTSSTLTTVAVFLPIAFVSGMVGQLFGSFAITVTAAMLASLVVALVVIPVLAYWFLKPVETTGGASAEEYRRQIELEERHGWLQRAYQPVITWSVAHRKSVLGGAVALLVGTVALLSGITTSFLGQQEIDSLTVTQTLPPGTDLAATDAAARRVEKVISGIDGVKSYQVTLGARGGFFGASVAANTASYTVVLTSSSKAESVQLGLHDKLDALTGVGTLTITSSSGPGGVSNDIEVDITADDEAALRTATRQVQQQLATLPELTDVHSNLSDSAPQIVVSAKGEQAAAAGVSDIVIASTIRQAVAGTTVTQVTLDGGPVDVVVRTAGSPSSIADLGALQIPTAAGAVRLDTVATVTKVNAPVERTRSDGQSTATVTGTPVGDNTGAASTAVSNALAKLTLPKGAGYTTGGVTADQNSAFSQLGLAMIIAIALVFLILVAVFRSLRQTLILLVSIPFAFTGALALLVVTGTPMGVAALIGMLMLIGIVVTNAIVLMDLINQYRERGLSVHDAVVEGGLRRLRPILMTAVATMLALAPMALGITGAGGFISQPLGVVVIGGLFTSTLLTLVLIPVLYTMIETARERRQQRRDQRRLAAQEAAQEPGEAAAPQPERAEGAPEPVKQA